MGLGQQLALLLLKLAIGAIHQGSHQGTAEGGIHPQDGQLHHQHQQLVAQLEGVGNEQIAHAGERHLPGPPLLHARWCQPGQQAAGSQIVSPEEVDVLHQLQLLTLVGVARQALIYAAPDLAIVIHRLDEEVARPRPQRPLDGGHLVLTRDDDDRHLGIAGGEAGDHLMPIHVGHVQVA